MAKLDSNKTVSFQAEGIDTVIGDEKKPDFHPRLKIKKWGNEANLSIGVTETGGSVKVKDNLVTWTKNGTEAAFYPFAYDTRPKITTMNQITGSELMDVPTSAAEYEMFRSTGWHDDFMVIWYRVNKPGLMLFAGNPAARYIKLVDGKAIYQSATVPGDSGAGDIPVVRVPGHIMANPYYYDKGLINYDMHFGNHDFTGVDEFMLQAVTEVMAKYGVKSVRGKGHKLYFHDGKKLVKYHSAEVSEGIMAGYINLDTEYLRAYDYYRPDVEKDIRDEYAYGLHRVFPNIPDNIMDEIYDKFTQLAKIQHLKRDYSKDELTKIERVKQLQLDPDWLSYGRRADAGWMYWPKENGFEFEVTMDSKPASNVYPLSVQTKGLAFHWQAPLTAEESSQGSYRPPHIENSWAAYNAEGKQNNEYQTGKAFHLYRPYVTDAQGWCVWADFDPNWDWASNAPLNITLPQDFLDKAVYPIVLDPTFGYTTAGGTTITLINTVLGLVDDGTPPAGTAVDMYAYLDLATSTAGMTGKARMALYAGSSLVFQSDEVTWPATVQTTDSWVTFSVASGAYTSTQHRIYAWAGWTGGTPSVYDFINLYYDTVTNAGLHKSVTYAANYASTLGSLTVDSKKYSVYYSTAAKTSKFLPVTGAG